MSKSATLLKPCPFCGEHEAELCDNAHDEYAEGVLYYTRCGNCGAEAPKEPTQGEAEMWWNKRESTAHSTVDGVS